MALAVKGPATNATADDIVEAAMGAAAQPGAVPVAADAAIDAADTAAAAIVRRVVAMALAEVTGRDSTAAVPTAA